MSIIILEVSYLKPKVRFYNKDQLRIDNNKKISNVGLRYAQPNILNNILSTWDQ